MTTPAPPGWPTAPGGGAAGFSSPAAILAALQQLRTGGGSQGQYNSGLAGITSAEAAQYKVFLGGAPMTSRWSDKLQNPLAPPQKNTERVMSADQAAALWFEWDDKKQKKWLEDLKERGILEEDASYEDAQSAWFGAVDEASKYFTLSGRRITPWQILDKWTTLTDKDGNGVPDNQEPRVSTSTQKSVDISDPDTARALTNDILKNALGRAATKDEIAAYAAALNSYEESNPSVSTTTTTTMPDGTSNSETESSGGASAAGRQQVLQDKAMQDPEYGAFQVAAPLMNAFFSAIQSPV